MEPRQSRCVGSVNRESAVSYVAASRCYSFSSKVKRQKERAGERLCFAHSLIRRSRCTIFAVRLLAVLLFFPANTADRICSASCGESVSAAFITSPGTHLGKGIRRDTCAPVFVCSSQTFASRSFPKRGASFTRTGQTRRRTYVTLPLMNLQTKTSGLSQPARPARKISRLLA